MEEENIKLFNERKTKYILLNIHTKKNLKRKGLEVVLQITIENLKQIMLKKDKAIQNFLMEINKYKLNNVQIMQSEVLKCY